MKTLVIGHEGVKQLLPMAECIDVMESLFRTLAAGEAVLPLRQAVSQPDGRGKFGAMPAYLGSPRSIGGKFITFFAENRSPYESHQGAVLLFDCESGQLLSMLDAMTITSIRTAAASACATNVLARKNASTLSILGSGTQATKHLESMQAVRKITEVKVWSRNPTHAQLFVTKASKKYPLKVERADSVEEAVADAEIVCTTTAATSPILEGRWIQFGCHINAVGSSSPPFRELDSEAVAISKFYTDRKESLFAEADDFRIPLQEGAINERHLIGEIGEVLIHKAPGRASDEDITLFKSLGIGVEDLASAHHIYSKALEGGVGVWVDFNPEREE